MRLLIVTTNNYPYNGTCSNIIQKLINEGGLGQKHSIDVLASKASIVSVFVVSTRTVPRIMLPALTPFFLAAAQPVANCVYDGKITRKGITIVGSLLLYDILMSLYYLWIAAAY